VIGVERTDFVALFVRDIERGRAFYGEMLGLAPNPYASADFPEFETGNVTIALVDPSRVGAEFSPSRAGVALRVPDVAEARRTLEEAGISFNGETMDTGVCHMAFFDDPDGNELVLHRRYAPQGAGVQP
jgi:predicted enzyme related to lactoylglutathione lyase